MTLLWTRVVMSNDRVYYSHDAEMHAMRNRTVLMLVSLTLGLGVSTVLALRFAPTSGKTVRDNLSKTVGQTWKYRRDAVESLMKQIEEAFSELKKNVEAHLKQPGQERGHVHIVLFADVLREIIRSLVITPNAEPSDVGAAEYNAGSANSLRRNFTQENLEVCLAEGCVMWIDITTPADDRVYCDDASTFSASRLVLDTAEAIRYPETEHIQGKVVITVAQ